MLLVHGWGGHAGQMLPLHPSPARAGTAARAGGTARTWAQRRQREHAAGDRRAVDYVAARLRQDGHHLRAVVAHSLGANASAYAASRGLGADRLVLIAPPASPREYTRLLAHVFGLSEATRAAMQRRIEAREGILMPLFGGPLWAAHRSAGAGGA